MKITMNGGMEIHTDSMDEAVELLQRLSGGKAIVTAPEADKKTKQCPVCGKAYKGYAQTCSRACGRVIFSKRMAEKREKRGPKKNYIYTRQFESTCQICGKTFMSHLPNGKVCSKTCAGKNLQIKRWGNKVIETETPEEPKRETVNVILRRNGVQVHPTPQYVPPQREEVDVTKIL